MKIVPMAVLLFAVACPVSWAGDPAGAGKVTPPAGPLDAQQLQVIQGIGQAVLAARQADGPSSVATALSQHLAALKASLQAAEVGMAKASGSLRSAGVAASADVATEAELVSSGHVIALHRMADGRFVQREGDSPRHERIPMQLRVEDAQASTRSHSADLVGEARAHVTAIRQSLAAPSEAVSERDAPARASATSLLAEADRVLGAGDALRIEDLRRVRDLLASKTLGEVLAEREAAEQVNGKKPVEPTPTISTLIHHR